jgi:FdhD protein
MGYEIATKVGMTMIGRATNRHYLLFSGAARFRVDAPVEQAPRSRAAAT